MKTKKALKGRIKVTGTGKLMRHKSGRRHLLVRKDAKRRRQLRRPCGLAPAVERVYSELLKPSL